MIEFRKNTARLTATVAEINARLEAGERLGTLTNLFIETTTPETFLSLFDQLLPALREDVVTFAKTNAASFDECIAWARDNGLYAEGWIGFRDWARAQPWFQEALTEAEKIKAREVPYDVELERELAFFEAELETAKTEWQREDIQHSLDGLRRDIARRNLGG